ncbi:hypothetical protein F4861DRAFT_550569 [Xylaria intraflava]|nr:hypothetical protein F4861DRAFT_550569 [Xylaria intraflava]
MALNHRHGYKTVAYPESAFDSPPRPTNQDTDDDGFDVWFLEFSNLYNLNLRRPNPSFAVEQTQVSSYYEDSSLYYRLGHQYRQGNADIIVRIFDKSAREIHSRWVKKAQGEIDVTPPTTDLPRVATESERTSLLDRLDEILELLSPGHHSSSSRSTSRRSKRPSDGGSTGSPSSKRSRCVMPASRPPTALSRLDSGEVRASTPLPQRAAPLPVRNVPSNHPQNIDHEQDVYINAPSANTSMGSFVSGVFTEPDAPDDFMFPATQETEVSDIIGSQQKRRVLSPSIASSFAPSSSTERLLEASFNSNKIGRQPVAPENSHLDLGPGSGDLESRQYESSVAPREELAPSNLRGGASGADDFDKRLEDVWSVATLPRHLQKAPFAVRWEMMRVALYCGVPAEKLHIKYEPILDDQARLWDRLRYLDAFEGKSLPEKSRPEAWKAAMNGRFSSTDQIVVLTATLTVNSSKEGPVPKLTLQPLKLELPHRLDRRFGSDRFLELVIPSINEIKPLGKPLGKDHESTIDSFYKFLVRGNHFFLGRKWTSFYTKPAPPKKIQKNDTLRPETTTVYQEKIYLFAEDGNDFLREELKLSESPKAELTNKHTKMSREQLLGWLLQIQKNQEQSVYKLFSRIALGLSRTHPTVVLQPEQIRHCNVDILSPNEKKVMNDGIGRMSTALARQIRDIMGLDDIPAGYQGRFGSAKGFWIRDTEDTSNEIWIETYPSQRKWKCDFNEEDHRTFEVRNASTELRSANLNLQLLPILEDRAIDPSDMKKQIGKFMRDSLELDLKSQKEAMQDPAHFKLWVHENAGMSRRQDRIRFGHMPWAAGLPTSKEDQMDFLLSHGFQPTKLEFLRKIAYDLRKDKCEELQTRLNVKVGRSTYAYMVIDFTGVLGENEIHLGFSSRFSDEKSGFSETFLHGMDVLVARTPAHYPSDIQRVKAVFKPELGSLKDVIIFSSKGEIPLADKLSGGDYDGDIAWVCWEPSIVNNFKNAELPNVPDLFRSGVLTKLKDTYAELAQAHGPESVVTEFIDRAFRFNMEQNLLGICTNYKEKLCYANGSVRDEAAIYLSTLISNLVDRAKQGIVFTGQHWNRERKRLNGLQKDGRRAKNRLEPPEPRYKKNNWEGDKRPTHIIDYVKFDVGKPTIERELKELDRYLGQAQTYDGDLVKFFEFFEKLQNPKKKDGKSGKEKKSTWGTILEELQKKIDATIETWVDSRDEFDVRLSNTYEMWRNIKPTDKVSSNAVRSLCETGLADVGLSQWDLLKASFCFKLYHTKHPKFHWYIAGYQLAYLKSIIVSKETIAPPVLMTPSMYAGTRPDAKFVRAVAALNNDRRVEQAGEELDDAESMIDQDE